MTGKIAAAIASEANSATQAELRQSAGRLAGAVIDALEPHLAARIPAIVEPAVAAALATHEATAARRVPDWMLWAVLATNVAAIAVTGLVLAALARLDAPGQALAQMRTARAVWLIEGLVDHAVAAGPVGSAAALWLARQVPDHPALPAIIAARLAGVPGLDVTRLASPTVLAALGPGQADLALQVTAAGLRRPAGSLAALRLVSAA